MSHFVVWVIGNDVEGILAPYHEYECTGVKKFLQYVDNTEHVKEDKPADCSWEDYFEHNYGSGYLKVDVDPLVSANTFSGRGYYILDSENNLVKFMEVTNPNSKWDWWSIGGRWADSLPAKIGGFCNISKKADIDFEGYKGNLYKKAEEVWNTYAPTIQKYEYKPFIFMYAENPSDRELARTLYKQQEIHSVLASEFPDTNFDPIFGNYTIEEFLVDLEQYKKNYFNARFFPFAIVDKERWIEKGEMGWFGSSTEIHKDVDWYKICLDYFESLDENEIITVVDCHI